MNWQLRKFQLLGSDCCDYCENINLAELCWFHWWLSSLSTNIEIILKHLREETSTAVGKFTRS